MIEWLVDTGHGLLLSFGLPVLFVLFIFKGAIIGKPFPTSVFLPGYLLAVSADRELIIISILVASFGYVCGQMAVYLLANRYGIRAVRSLPGVCLSDAQLERGDRLFRRYSGVGIFITNLVPYVGTFIMIPAGIASYPFGRATAYGLVSTVLNYVIIVWIVVGSVRFIGAV